MGNPISATEDEDNNRIVIDWSDNDIRVNVVQEIMSSSATQAHIRETISLTRVSEGCGSPPDQGLDPPDTIETCNLWFTEYTRWDLGGTSEGDSGSFVGGNSFVITDGPWTATVTANIPPNHYDLVLTDQHPELVMFDTPKIHLDDTAPPIGPSPSIDYEVAHAFEYNLLLGPNLEPVIIVFDKVITYHPDVEARATIEVNKNFNDQNPMEVIVHLDCTSGLIPDQDQNPDEDNNITFVITDFDAGDMDCWVTETPVPNGYEAYYSTEFQGNTNKVECEYLDIMHGDELQCFISNELIPIDFDVKKDWMDEHPEFNNSTYVKAGYNCYNESSVKPDDCLGCPFGGGSYQGHLTFNGDPAYDDFDVWPHWNGLTTCTVEERIKDSSVESDDSDCDTVMVLVGQADADVECTIYNTRIYEGIPTLNQYALALLALLMLAVGLVAFRRIA